MTAYNYGALNRLTSAVTTNNQEHAEFPDLLGVGGVREPGRHLIVSSRGGRVRYDLAAVITAPPLGFATTVTISWLSGTSWSSNWAVGAGVCLAIAVPSTVGIIRTRGSVRNGGTPH